MPMKLFTGTPGAGKTLSALEEICKIVGVNPRNFATSDELIEALRNREDPRLIFVCGVEGLVEGIFEPLADPRDWQDCPDGSVILVDEIWKWWGSHIPKAKEDERILALAEHRHRGMTFILTCQNPAQIMAHVRALIDEHVHVARKFGTELTERFSWASICDDPNSLHARKRGSGGVPWRYPKTVMGLYQSATIHTIKRKIPLRVMMLPALALGMVALFALGGWKVSKFIWPDVQAQEAPVAQRSEQQVLPAHSAADKGPSDQLLTQQEFDRKRTDWALKHTPLVESQPWSAPAFAGRAVVAEPRLLCYISYRDNDDGECKCFTEQATRYFIADTTCRDVAKNGEPYNPYRRPGRILTTDSGQPEENVGGGVAHKPAGPMAEHSGGGGAESGSSPGVISGAGLPTGPATVDSVAGAK